VFFKVRRSTRLLPVMQAFRAKLLIADTTPLKFMFDGHILDAQHTFSTYEMVDQDVIDAMFVTPKIEEAD
jgi:hypothetical protein